MVPVIGRGFDLTLALPGVWTWISLRKETVEDAIARLPETTEIDLVGFIARVVIAQEGGSELLGLCTDFEGASFDLQLDIAHAVIVPREDGETREPIETAAWAYRFYFGRGPKLDDLFDGPNGLPTLRYEHPAIEAVSYVCTPPDDSDPVLVRISSLEENSRSHLQEIGNAILLRGEWLANEEETPAG